MCWLLSWSFFNRAKNFVFLQDEMCTHIIQKEQWNSLHNRYVQYLMIFRSLSWVQNIYWNYVSLKVLPSQNRLLYIILFPLDGMDKGSSYSVEQFINIMYRTRHLATEPSIQATRWQQQSDTILSQLLYILGCNIECNIVGWKLNLVASLSLAIVYTCSYLE